MLLVLLERGKGLELALHLYGRRNRCRGAELLLLHPVRVLLQKPTTGAIG